MASTWIARGESENSSMKLSHPLHANSLLSVLNETRKNPSLCDGTLVIGDTEISVQRNILAAASPYFRALYSYEVPHDEETTFKSRVNFDEGLTPAIFEQILDYIYTSDISLCEDNIQDILQAADLLLMCDLKQLCCEYLVQCITVGNCLGIRDFAEHFTCPRVLHEATQFMDDHFLEVSYAEEFMQLPVERVKDVLQRNSLLIQTEDAIFDCVTRWVRHDPQQRREKLQELLQTCVHMALLDERYVQEHVIPDELIRCCHLGDLVLRMRQEDTTKKQRGYTNIIVVAGGEGPCPDEQTVVEIKRDVRCVPFSNYPEQRGCVWITLAAMLQARVGHGMVEAGGCVYAIGGRDNTGRILNGGEKYDPANNTWTAIPPMAHARLGFGLLSMDDKIYALGGSNDMSDPLTSMEEFNIYTNTWRSLPDMNLKRAWSAYAVCSKKIYVIGGGVMGKLYEAVECFDPRSEAWVSVAPMKERRFDARAIGYGTDIFVFGGLRRLECPSVLHTGSGMKFCNTEVYSSENKHWMALNRDLGFCTMTETCHIDAVMRCNEEIIVIGDLDIGGRYNCVRAFCPGSNSWRGLIQNHPPYQKGMQGCVVKIPTAQVYELLAEQGKPWNDLPCIHRRMNHASSEYTDTTDGTANV